jgi:type I restriction enzyme S subunit
MNKEFFSLKLSEIADVVAGQSPESIYYSKIEGVPFLQGNRTFGTLYPSIDTFTSKVTKLAKKDEVLISVRAPVGDLNFAPCDLCIGRGLASIKAKNGNNKFIYYALKYNVNNLLRQGSGTTFDSVNKDVINDLELIVPEDTTDRDKVAQVLSSLDSKIELNNRINSELEAMAKTLYDYWFVQFDFPDKNGKPYKTSGGKMVWNEELRREIPEGWDTKELNKLGDIIGGSTPSKAVEENFCVGNGMPWITPKDLSINKGKKYITRGELDVTEIGLKSASLKIMPAGTVLLSSRAPIGYLAISRSNVTTNQGFKSFVPNSKFSTEFIFYTIKNLIPEIEANSSGSTFQEVSTSTLRTIKTVFPSNDILTIFDKKIKPIFKQQDVLEEENQKLAELRDWLLPMLMNGQVKVSER